MKRVYERPLFYVDTFMANTSIAACDASTMTTQCLQGNQTENWNLVSSQITTTCETNAGYVNTAQYGIIGAFKIGSSNGTSQTVSTKINNTSGRLYRVPAGADALLYFCGSGEGGHGGHGGSSGSVTVGDTSQWQVNPDGFNGYLVHSDSHSQGVIHCEVIGVSSSTVASV